MGNPARFNSYHILKPSMPNYGGHHLNEYLCLRAAQLAGLEAAKGELLASDRFEVLISHRYDRLRTAGRWQRLHQEDMCQALSVHPALKYQSEGGPGVPQLADLLASNGLSVGRRNNQHRLFDYLVYNITIGATDAHAKNYSVLLSFNDIRLAPLYDVASILPCNLEPGLRSAMKIGDTWEMAKVSESDWTAVGRRLGMTRDESIHRARTIQLAVPAAIHQAATEPAVPDALREGARRIAELITAHAEGRRDAWGRVASP